MDRVPASSRDLRLYVINEAGAAQETLDAAGAEAATIWANGGLRLVWNFPPIPPEVQGGETLVVVVRRALSPPATTDGADLRIVPILRLARSGSVWTDGRRILSRCRSGSSCRS